MPVPVLFEKLPIIFLYFLLFSIVDCLFLTCSERSTNKVNAALLLQSRKLAKQGALRINLPKLQWSNKWELIALSTSVSVSHVTRLCVRACPIFKVYSIRSGESQVCCVRGIVSH